MNVKLAEMVMGSIIYSSVAALLATGLYIVIGGF